MDLWIRTQNRENTVKVINGYGLKYNDKQTIISNYQPDFTDKYDGYYEVLGTYKSKERALEVLDEIQKILQPSLEIICNTTEQKELLNNVSEILIKPKIDDIKIQQFKTYVYEMPKE